MSDELRQSVVRATIPLLGEYETLTTARIARAADIAESDLLAHFADKEAVVQACAAWLTGTVREAMNPAPEIQRLIAIPPGRPLDARLVAVIDILDDYQRRVRAELDEILTGPAAPEVTGRRPAIPDGELRQAVATVLEPDEQHLRLPAGVLAEAFVGMAYGGMRPVDPQAPPIPATQLVDLFLHGALRTR
ncbi:TetR family transcriptional regulator [Actinoplanes sp. RD1]|uniref:TetR family transcriptional regulator n=1 Tax=Actinoplanes sp. RD1 TaxID=3064538 RepID=UPI0027409333|nr:TetR family transcriptional regulator [Actinoplanes sp. RD1]